MIVTRDVIVDLLPLYLAGEASPGTRALVIAYLARDPELAEQARRQQRDEGMVAPASALPDLEMQALLRTRRLMGVRHWLFGLSWFFTALALSFQIGIGPNGVEYMRLVALDFPRVFGPIVAIAVGCWTGYYLLRRQSR